ncbi:MAG: hypothetical protein PHQ34_10440 [Methanothrix sp.]|nr:hypothetical protein [Methanothrix sp.]
MELKNKELVKFEGIISELKRRDIVVLTHRPTRWGYVVDAVIPSKKVVVLKSPDSFKFDMAMSMLHDLTTRLIDDGYHVLMIPSKGMNAEQISAFCDRILVETSLLPHNTKS